MSPGRSPLAEVLPGVRDCLRDDGWAIAPVAGALLLLPLLLLLRAIGLDLLAPRPEPGAPPGAAVALLLVAVLVASVLGQLVITAIAVGAGGATVGQLFQRLLRRLPEAFAVGFVQALPASIGLQAMASGTPGLAFAGAVLAGVGVYLFARLMVALPVLVAEGKGVLPALRRSWHLTAGRSLGLVALLAGLLVGFLLLAILVVAVSAPVAAIVTLVLGEPAVGWGGAQWVNGLVLAALQTALTVLVALVAGRTYRVLAG